MESDNSECVAPPFAASCGGGFSSVDPAIRMPCVGVDDGALLVCHNLELRAFVRGFQGRRFILLALEQLQNKRVSEEANGEGNEGEHTSLSACVRVASSLTLASFMRSRTPTSWPSMYSTPVRMESAIAYA